MGDMTRNFSRSEFACKCGCGKDNISPKLVGALQALRDTIGEPIIINCGCRCVKHNKEIGGVKDSQHVLGKAADIRCKNLSPKELKKFAEQIPEFNNGGIGLYKTFLHVDVRGNKARWNG
jgi:uncharacterized protein YcbK (DUF882 family)